MFNSLLCSSYSSLRPLQLRPEEISQFWTVPLTSEYSCLSVLDLRSCGDASLLNIGSALRPFNEFFPNIFTRDARWGEGQLKLFDKVLNAPLDDGSGILSVGSLSSLARIRSGSFGSGMMLGWGNALEPKYKAEVESPAIRNEINKDNDEVLEF